jgi:hypothetical protein
MPTLQKILRLTSHILNWCKNFSLSKAKDRHDNLLKKLLPFIPTPQGTTIRVDLKDYPNPSTKKLYPKTTTPGRRERPDLIVEMEPK